MDYLTQIYMNLENNEMKCNVDSINVFDPKEICQS
jgi:hypothetical protein